MPVGGSMASRYLNEPSIRIHPCVNVRNVGMTWAMVVPFRKMTGPTTSCAHAMNSICHHRRNAGTRPASATSEPMMVAGIAALVQDKAEPYTSMRLLAAAMVSRAATVRLAYCAACGWLVLGMAGDLPLRDIQMTEWVEFAHEPVPVPVAMPVLVLAELVPVPVRLPVKLPVLVNVVLMPAPP